MAGITLEQAETSLALWIAAEAAVAEGQEFELMVNGVNRKIKLADADVIQKNITLWNNRCRRLSRGGITGRRGSFA